MRTAYVYEIRSWDGDLLYVGKTKNPFIRLGQHATLQPWAAEIASAVITPYESEEEALAAEAWAIAALRPLFNVTAPHTTGTRAPAPVGPSTLWSVPGPRPEANAPSTETLTGSVFEVRKYADLFQEEARHVAARFSDPLEGFLPGVLEPCPDIPRFRLSGADLFSAYVEWETSRGTSPRARYTRRELFADLNDRGYAKVKTARGVAFGGLRFAARDAEGDAVGAR